MLSSLSSSSAPSASTSGSNFIKDVGIETFIVDVIEASKKNLVVVDFWAPWCGPCKQLGPVLEKLVASYNGALHLAKVDIDRNPEISQQMGVQSIPAVFAFYQGRPVDGFMGALPETQVKGWIDRLVKAIGITVPAGKESYDEALQFAADSLARNEVTAAQDIYANILEEDPLNSAAYAGMVRCLIAIGDIENAKLMLDKAPQEIAKDKIFESVRAALELAEQTSRQKEKGSLESLEVMVATNPQDYQARFDLAMAHYAAGHKQEAVDALLEIVRFNRTWNEDAARKQLVKFFEAFGVMDPVTVAARKRLSSLLFS